MALFRNNPVLAICPNQNQKDKEIFSVKFPLTIQVDNCVPVKLKFP